MAVDTSIPEQVPYVPSEARITKEKARKDKNAVVQVAKSSNSAKKRKTKADVKVEQPVDVQMSDVNETNSPAPPAKKAKRTPVKAEDIPEFDYSQEPNQLDTFEPSSTVKDKRRKPKKSKQRTFNAVLHLVRVSLTLLCLE
jgi:exosome complex exonuclease RRP6